MLRTVSGLAFEAQKGRGQLRCALKPQPDLDALGLTLHRVWAAARRSEVRRLPYTQMYAKQRALSYH